jgi:hypothetical protein
MDLHGTETSIVKEKRDQSVDITVKSESGAQSRNVAPLRGRLSFRSTDRFGLGHSTVDDLIRNSSVDDNGMYSTIRCLSFIGDLIRPIHNKSI